MFRIILASTIALSAAAASPALAAQPKAAGDSAIVHYGDLDLSSGVGALSLDHRIQAAATKVCGDADQRDPHAWSQMMACRNVAMTGSRQQVAMLTGNVQRPGVRKAKA